jgi:copper chaperone
MGPVSIKNERRNNMAKVTFNIPGISCGHCERTIIKALQPLDGVRRVTVDISSKQAEVDYADTRITVERMKEVLIEADYPAVSVRVEPQENSLSSRVAGRSCCGA